MNNTFTFVIKNSGSVAGNFTLFGWNEYGSNGGQSPSVSVAVSQSGNDQIRRDLADGAYRIAGMKIRSTNTAQFENAITYNFKSVNGQSESYEINPLDYFSADQKQSNQVDIPADKVNYIVTSESYLSGVINADTTLTIIMTVASKTKSNFLDADGKWKKNIVPTLLIITVIGGIIWYFKKSKKSK